MKHAVRRAIQSGFTIVELLIVVVVIAILATITIVAYNGIQNQARIATMNTDLSSIEKKIKMHAAEFNDTLPGTSGDTGSLAALKESFTGMNSKITWSAQPPYGNDTSTTPRTHFYINGYSGSDWGYVTVYFWDFSENNWSMQAYEWNWQGLSPTRTSSNQIRSPEDRALPCKEEAIELCRSAPM